MSLYLQLENPSTLDSSSTAVTEDRHESEASVDVLEKAFEDIQNDFAFSIGNENKDEKYVMRMKVNLLIINQNVLY